MSARTVDMNKCPPECYERYGLNCPNVEKCIKKGVFKEKALKVGNIVTIYEDPMTEKKPEGKAKLIRQLPQENDPLEYWLVQFVGDDDTVYRWIRREETAEERAEREAEEIEQRDESWRFEDSRGRSVFR